VIAHLTFVQSNFPIFFEIFTFWVKRPPGKNSSVKPTAYGGGLDEIQKDASLNPALLTPPPHGVGALPLAGITQKAR
jgi:hypothetical protein